MNSENTIAQISLFDWEQLKQEVESLRQQVNQSHSKTFIQVGDRFFATAHITAIDLDATCALGVHTVSLNVAGNPVPWNFLHGTPEAQALTKWVKANAEVLEKPCEWEDPDSKQG